MRARQNSAMTVPVGDSRSALRSRQIREATSGTASEQHQRVAASRPRGAIPKPSQPRIQHTGLVSFLHVISPCAHAHSVTRYSTRPGHTASTTRATCSAVTGCRRAVAILVVRAPANASIELPHEPHHADGSLGSLSSSGPDPTGGSRMNSTSSARHTAPGSSPRHVSVLIHGGAAMPRTATAASAPPQPGTPISSV